MAPGIIRSHGDAVISLAAITPHRLHGIAISAALSLSVELDAGDEMEAACDPRLGFINAGGSLDEVRRYDDSDAAVIGLFAQAVAYAGPKRLLAEGNTYRRVDRRVVSRYVTADGPIYSAELDNSRFRSLIGGRRRRY